ncbi:PadR family transcriptional regulator [Sedimentibacter hydroxybenzoicus DSM 7310]|uniref:PadR family transcriptional regulator n=1 Tax=Sedimentibacter hydroxybenzoicus DSM 7310 TaxID=1123245 RepID=A0A974BJR7_SEDHY|nr:PadR family transcriptional regulator [Sedimentibacter hydroxybenzoicus]NYB74161.1 PadR family transcriptional regulator [Sedimentibacter hydroxybenzoicus DSM 7310]
MVDKSQLLRGTLEGCIVKIIGDEETYGYEIISRLQDYGFDDVREGTTYPILVRLERKKFITSKYKESPLGPKRKYYFLTETGEEFLNEFQTVWNDVKESVDKVMKGE